MIEGSLITFGIMISYVCALPCRSAINSDTLHSG